MNFFVAVDIDAQDFTHDGDGLSLGEEWIGFVQFLVRVIQWCVSVVPDLCREIVGIVKNVRSCVGVVIVYQ